MFNCGILLLDIPYKLCKKTSLFTGVIVYKYIIVYDMECSWYDLDFDCRPN